MFNMSISWWELIVRGVVVYFFLLGRPQILIHNGKLFEDVVARAHLTHHELQAALRRGGCSCVDEVHSAILENSGDISVVPIKARSASAGE